MSGMANMCEPVRLYFHRYKMAIQFAADEITKRNFAVPEASSVKYLTSQVALSNVFGTHFLTYIKFR